MILVIIYISIDDIIITFCIYIKIISIIVVKIVITGSNVAIILVRVIYLIYLSTYKYILFHILHQAICLPSGLMSEAATQDTGIFGARLSRVLRHKPEHGARSTVTLLSPSTYARGFWSANEGNLAADNHLLRA